MRVCSALLTVGKFQKTCVSSLYNAATWKILKVSVVTDGSRKGRSGESNRPVIVKMAHASLLLTFTIR